jgi:hypothetical protein
VLFTLGKKKRKICISMCGREDTLWRGERSDKMWKPGMQKLRRNEKDQTHDLKREEKYLS